MRYDGQQIHIYQLIGDTHRLAETRVVLAGVTSADVAHFLELSQEMTRAAWIRHIQAWAQTRNQGEGDDTYTRR
jgi:hypothetical protein